MEHFAGAIFTPYEAGDFISFPAHATPFSKGESLTTGSR